MSGAGIETGYAPVNGLQMYYEVHGAGQPLVLLHGALSAIGTSFGRMLPALARSRQVIAVEQQAHGRTADVDRPLSVAGMADDTAALLRYLGVERADLFGYSLGAAIALEMGIRHGDLVRKLVLASVTYTADGLHPGLLAGLDQLQPEHLAGTPWQEEYARIAPRPADWPTLVAKVTDLNRRIADWPAEAVQAIQAPTMIVAGDSDIVRPEHAVEMFRLLGGGVPGDTVGLPQSRLAILPGTTHVTVVERADWLVPMVEEFLDAPLTPA
ncbi:MAG: alpha/beta hydrolase [Thermomicrobiaceae bacterium]|nr:alpha/beta hydrolase [Thermomicrobiaceae bacterium]